MLFNTLEVDSNSDKITYYDENNLYDMSFHTLYFKDLTSIKLDEIIKKYNINVFSYVIDGNKYYARSIDELSDIYYKNLSLSEKLYFDSNGYNIDAINVLCTNQDIINIKNIVHVY